MSLRFLKISRQSTQRVVSHLCFSADEIGLPAKSGVSGIVISVVPNVMGLATFSPRLDKFGNSVRLTHLLRPCAVSPCFTLARPLYVHACS